MKARVQWLPEDGILDQVAIDRVVRDRQFTPITRSEAVIAANLLTKAGVVAHEVAQLLRCAQRTVERFLDEGLNLEYAA